MAAHSRQFGLIRATYQYFVKFPQAVAGKTRTTGNTQSDRIIAAYAPNF
jgi:hypothetical protein